MFMMSVDQCPVPLNLRRMEASTEEVTQVSLTELKSEHMIHCKKSVPRYRDIDIRGSIFVSEAGVRIESMFARYRLKTPGGDLQVGTCTLSPCLPHLMIRNPLYSSFPVDSLVPTEAQNGDVLAL